MADVIELRQLTRWYGKRRGVIDVDVNVRDGEVFGFLGPNGAGKTTTIRMLLGFIRPTAGTATVFGLDAWRDAPAVHHRVAHLSGEPAYLGEMTAGRLLDYLGTLRGLRATAWRGLAERLDLDPSVPIKKLSRGNRQKVGVVQAFMGTEPLLVMDEPTTGLDPLMQREFLALVGEARAAGRTIFLSSHNLPEVERTCDRIGIIRDGRLVEISTVTDLLRSHWRSINIVLNGSPPPLSFWEMENVRTVSFAGGDVHLMVRGDVNPLLRRLAQVDVRDVSISTPEIEDVFYRFYDEHEPGDGPGSHEVAAALTGRTGAPGAPGSPVPAEVLR